MWGAVVGDIGGSRFEGIVAPDRLYESPFTDITPHGPDDLFNTAELDELMHVLETVRATAIAA